MEIQAADFGKIESLLFIAGDEGLTAAQIARILEWTKEEVERAIQLLLKHYESHQEVGLTIKQFGGKYQLVTKSEHADLIGKLLENPSSQSMTQASMEVLAIVAYKQPVTKIEIDDLRGVKSDGPLHTLIAKGFIMEKGRLEGIGRPILYGTTELFLDRFGLESLDQLPPLAEDTEDDMEENDLFMTKFQEVFEVDEGGTSS